MAGAASVERAVATLARDRRRAIKLAQAAGSRSTRELLKKAAGSLSERLATAEGLSGAGSASFSAGQLRAALIQVRAVQGELNLGLQDQVLELAAASAEGGVEQTLAYLAEVDEAFRGVGGIPLALDEARMLEAASQGVRSSVLRRLGSSGTEEAEGVEEAAVESPARAGILARYGQAGIGEFEDRLRVGLLARKSWGEMRDDLVSSSPFLQGKPSWWADRIVRTEVMGAYNAAGWESAKEANEELGDVVKILSATFDDRTGADSFAVHGQVRRVEEPFEWWGGLYQHPPNRPNDREVVAAHRLAWPIPPALQALDDDAVAAAWERDGRKGAPPERPLMSTIPLDQFGGG